MRRLSSQRTFRTMINLDPRGLSTLARVLAALVLLPIAFSIPFLGAHAIEPYGTTDFWLTTGVIVGILLTISEISEQIASKNANQRR